VVEIAEKLGRVLDVEVEPEVTGKLRAGDVRHCFADVSLARDVLGFEPEVELERGMEELAEWLEGQVADDRVDEARRELSSRGLTV
jgi:dTDP-L-rhamnose 4-epimerase